MTTSPQIACIQMNSQQDVAANLATIEKAVTQACHLGAKVVVFPENMCSMGRQRAVAQQFDELSDKLSQIARMQQVHLLAGTLPCPYRPDGTTISDGRVRQVSQLFDPSGQRIARYDKIHLFRATVSDTQGNYDEAQTFEAGEQIVVAPCEIDGLQLNIGMMVCFDLRFPALAQRLRQAGADVLTAPSAFTYKTGQAHWSTLLQARALDAQCMVVGAAQGGTHHYPNQTDRQTWGHAAITNANGQIVAYHDSAELKLTNTIDSDSSNNQPETATKQQCEHTELHHGDFAIITASFNQEEQQNWRQNLPINRCHRLA